jgi:hypothetical protein
LEIAQASRSIAFRQPQRRSTIEGAVVERDPTASALVPLFTRLIFDRPIRFRTKPGEDTYIIPLLISAFDISVHHFHCKIPLLALNVIAGTARFRQLSGAFRKINARCEFFSP